MVRQYRAGDPCEVLAQSAAPCAVSVAVIIGMKLAVQVSPASRRFQVFISIIAQLWHPDRHQQTMFCHASRPPAPLASGSSAGLALRTIGAENQRTKARTKADKSALSRILPNYGKVPERPCSARQPGAGGD